MIRGRPRGGCFLGRAVSMPRSGLGRRSQTGAACRCARRVCTPAHRKVADAATIGTRKYCTCYDMHRSVVPYVQAMEWQKATMRELCDNRQQSERNGCGYVVILQHDHVFTLGTGSTTANLRVSADAMPHPLHRTERGGEVTYHGPGQLVMYPILDLKQFRMDLHWYLRSLEDVVMLALEEVAGIQGDRIPGLTGVWVDGAKVCAMGIKVSRWVAYHGLALNVTCDLAQFSSIVPCGINSRPVTSVRQLLLTASSGNSLAHDTALLAEFSCGLLDAFEEVFGVELHRGDLPDWLLPPPG